MTLAFVNVAMPKSARTVTSKYDFGSLTVGGPALVETEVITAEKTKSKLVSAMVAYRARSKDMSKFSIRAFKNADGTDAVGCWKIADTPSVASA